MNRRRFLKRAAGATCGLALFKFFAPHKLKCAMAVPVTNAVGKLYLDNSISENIRKYKNKFPNWKIGETHCHSKYSDGNFEVHDILRRSSRIGLDFIVITEHLSVKDYKLEYCLASLADRWKYVQSWEGDRENPITVYPGFEISTQQGHLIMVFPEDFLNPKYYRDIQLQFGGLDRNYIPIDSAAQLIKPFDGISIIAHPNQHRDYPFGADTQFVKQNLVGLVDGVEDFSTGHGYLEQYSKDLGMASIGSSDDHFNMTIGTAVTGYNGAKYKDLISAVKAHDTRALKIDNSLDDFFAAAKNFVFNV